MLFVGSILKNIHSPADVKALKASEVRLLANECRQEIIETVSKNGGHLSSNLGVVELTIALHRVFDSGRDAFIFDVSHQCYTHKLLTGRAKDFETLRTLGGLSGFQKQGEGEHDFFDNGHASSAISQALGLLCARKITNPNDKTHAIAIIGDGALTGGLAFEALSNAGMCGYAQGLVIIVNDNQMSISRNTGALSSYLSRLTMTSHYQAFRRFVDTVVAHVPLFGKVFTRIIFRLKRAVKAMFFSNNLFSDLDLEYVGPLDGHDERTLERILRRVAKMNKAVVVHVLTKKGKGYKMAEDFPERFHGVGPFCIADGKMEVADKVSFTEVFSAAILSQALRNPKVVCVSAAMAKGTGLSSFARHFPKRFFDVGIAESHAVTFAGGLAKGGAIPVVAIYSSFIQRAVDQVIEDAALQGFHIVFVLDRAGPVPFDGETHQGVFDIALFSCVPRLKILSPATAEDMELCLDYAINQCTAPVIIRLPKTSCPPPVSAFSKSIIEGRGVLLSYASAVDTFGDGQSLISKMDSAGKIGKTRGQVLLVATGSLFFEVERIARTLCADIYTLRFIKPIDEEYFLEIAKRYKKVIFFEDGVLIGGVSQRLALLLRQKGFCNVEIRAFPDKFLPQGSRSEILKMAGLGLE